MITGSIVAMVTPMTVDGDIDWQALCDLIDWHVTAGTGGIVAVGTTGESATLNVDEHCDVITRAVDYADGRIPVIAGTGANSTSEAIELTRAASKAKADACLLVTPYYNKPTQEGLYLHFKAVAEAVPIAQILYNVPGRTAVDMSNDTVLRLAQIDNIVGIKDATGNVERGAELVSRCGDQLTVYSGDDATALELMLLGAMGNISVTANVAPVAMAQMCAAAIAGDRQRAEQINEPLLALHRDLFVESNPIPVKWALAQMGKIGPGIRLPMTPLSARFHPQVHSALQIAGVL